MSKYDITLQMNRFIAIVTDKRVMCWRQTLLAVDMHTFHTNGDKHFSAGDEQAENVHSNFSHTHSQLPAKQNLCRAYLRKCALSRWGDPKVM